MNKISEENLSERDPLLAAVFTPIGMLMKYANTTDSKEKKSVQQKKKKITFVMGSFVV